MKPQLLRWQQRALDKYKQGIYRNPGAFVLVAGTGTGKTMVAAACVAHGLSLRPDARVLIGVPTRSVKRSWQRTLRKWNIITASKPTDIDGDTSAIVSTYAGVDGMLRAMGDEVGGAPLILVFDEFHHLENNGDWRKPFDDLKTEVVNTILLSGTPWHETGSLDGVAQYDEPTTVTQVDSRGRSVKITSREVQWDFKYTYGENVNAPEDERNTVAVRFEPLDAVVEVETVDNETGEVLSRAPMSTTDTTPSSPMSPFVRFASYEDLLSERCGHIRAMLDKAVPLLDAQRKLLSCAGGIVFVGGWAEGDAVRTYLLRQHGIKALFVYSEDPKSHAAIETFECDKDAKWIIAMDMISEGTDIPRLKVAVDLSYKMTLLHILQRWGRILRLLRTLGDRALHPDEIQIPATVFFIRHAMLAYVADMIEKDCRKHEKAGGGGEGPPPPPGKTSRVTVKGDGEFSEAVVFKGESVAVAVDELAMWIVDSDYKGHGRKMGYHSALWLAKVLLADDAVPPAFHAQTSPPAAQADALRNIGAAGNEAERLPKEKQDAKNRAKRLLAALTEEFYGGAYSDATTAVNRRMGIDKWTEANKTLVQLEARANAIAGLLKDMRGDGNGS